MWSLCLTSRQGRKIVKLPPTATTKNLYDTAEAEFGEKVAELKFGFPPTLAPSSEDQKIQTILQNQERIQVEFSTATSGGKSKGTKVASKSKSTAKNPHESSTSSRSKRVAAQRATENMPDVIKAQEKILREQQTTKSSKRQRTNSSGASSPASSKRSTKPSAPKFTASAGQGRRLADGSTVSAPKGRKRSSPGGILGSASSSQPSDMSEALMGALNDSGKMGQVLRKGMKNAVQASYETSRAFSRLAAIQAKKFTMTLQEAASSSILVVAYHGSVDKTKTEEQVDCIPRDVLEAVLKGIHASNTEALRPENLALLSPRVLWSLVYIFPDKRTVPDMYRELLPDLDWKFLRRRAQQLSGKAMENLRQEEEAKGTNDDDREAAQAIAAVENAMENLEGYTAAERQARQAQAALNRLQASKIRNEGDDEVPWKIETPSESDRDELRECMDGTTTGDQITRLINRLMRECQIHNWRELANVDDVPALAEKLQVPASQVQTWVDRAQDHSVDEIIVAVCDNNVRAVELLIEIARSGTPKDLAAWRNIPQLLYQRMAGREDAPSIEDLRTWSQRAYQLLQEFEWLNWYATPVE